jgi:adenylate cyclase
VGLEIERKFLVINADWRSRVLRGQTVCDALAPFGCGKVRIRLGDGEASITFKGPRDGLSRLELEYTIPVRDAEQLIGTLQPTRLRLKTRYWVPVQGIMWLVDVHESPFRGLVTAEVELDCEAQPMSRPSWLGEELTGTPTEVAFQMSRLCLASGSMGMEYPN